MLVSIVIALLITFLVSQLRNLYCILIGTQLALQPLCFLAYVLLLGEPSYYNSTVGQIDFDGQLHLPPLLFFGLALLTFAADRLIVSSLSVSGQYSLLAKSIYKPVILRSAIVFSWPLSLLSPLIPNSAVQVGLAFLLNIFSGASLFIPAFARSTRITFWLAFAAAAPLGVIYGARGNLLYPIAFYCLGSLIKSENRLRTLTIQAVLLFPLSLLSSILGVARYAFRGSETVSFAQLSALYSVGSELATITGRTTDALRDMLLTLIERVVQWPVIIGIVQNGFSGRGYSDLVAEIIFAFNLSNIASDQVTVQEVILDRGWLYGSSRFLGYDSAVGWTVPVNMLADGIIRGGIVGAAINMLSFLLFIVFVLRALGNSTWSKLAVIYVSSLILVKFPESHTINILKTTVQLGVLSFVFLGFPRKYKESSL